MHPRQRVHPQRQSKSSSFEENWGDLDGGKSYSCSFGVFLKKGRQRFGEDKILAMPMS